MFHIDKSVAFSSLDVIKNKNTVLRLEETRFLN